MLSWLKGGPPAAPGNMFASTSNDKDLRNGNMATLQDEDAFTDTSSAEGEDASGDDVQPSQTPAPMFALKAIRTVVWGTPAPPKPREHSVRRKQRSPRSKRAAIVAKEEKEKRKKEESPPVKVEETKLELPKSTTTRALRNPKALDPIPFKISPKLNLFDSSSSSSTNLPPALETGTPARPSSPSKGILMTPGTALTRKKAVSFHPSIAGTAPPPKNNHIRSGLPHEFPGKFPSPWTPRVRTPQHRRSISVPGPGSPARTLTFEEGPLNLDKGKLDKGKKPERSTASNPTGYYEVGEDSRITDYLDESDDEKAAQQLQLEISMHEGNTTVDMNAPRSGSGKFWKERTQTVEAAALEKIDKLKVRCKTATGYAKKKDELCVDLAEKMREVMEKNKRLKVELNRLSAQSGSTTGNYALSGTTSSRATGHSHALEEAMNAIEERDAQIAASMAEKAHMENVIQRHKEKLEAFEEMLDNRESKITALSMSMYSSNDGEDLEDVVYELKKKLRTAKQEIKELVMIRQEARCLRERVESLEQGFTDVTIERGRMKRELEKLRGDEDEANNTTKRPQLESRLRQQVEVLEKSRRELRAEMREKTLADLRDRREVERKLKVELAELKGKVGNGWEKERLEYEMNELKKYATKLERELETTKQENDEFKKRSFNNIPAARDGGAREWQMKQRSTLQELRRAKEETSTLRTQKAQVEERLKDLKIEVENFKEARAETRTGLSLKPASAAPETKETESASDDSAVDRSFDRWTNVARSPATDASNYNPRAKNLNSTATVFDSPPVPALVNRQKRLFHDELSQNGNPDIFPTPPEFSAFMDIPKRTENNADDSFYTQRRQKESPRAKIVNIAISPPAPVPTRKVSGVGTVVPRRTTSSGVASRLRNMDPARVAAAEKRIADRKKAKMIVEDS